MRVLMRVSDHLALSRVLSRDATIAWKYEM
ncbi:protein of unknown function [Methanoculleus bourgensis]|uniref:Uncharacterized protein n=1 Tax=Methanoculleus bourgensis TaxID=83986 RepID=A0A0X3BJ85_9EURY|nr:protein of unknown function [Methanoculleus bourgensis]